MQQAKSIQVSSNNGPTKLSTAIITPETVRPHRKAEARQKSNKGRGKGKYKSVTDKPEKLAIDAEKTLEKCTQD